MRQGKLRPIPGFEIPGAYHAPQLAKAQTRLHKQKNAAIFNAHSGDAIHFGKTHDVAAVGYAGHCETGAAALKGDFFALFAVVAQESAYLSLRGGEGDSFGMAYGFGLVMKIVAEFLAQGKNELFDIDHRYHFPCSLSNIIRTRPARRILASDFISFFGGRQPTCIIQFCLTQNPLPWSRRFLR